MLSQQRPDYRGDSNGERVGGCTQSNASCHGDGLVGMVVSWQAHATRLVLAQGGHLG